jgi:hypothetical protein
MIIFYQDRLRTNIGRVLRQNVFCAGRLAFSVDGHRWTYASTPAYNGTITFTNGSAFTVQRANRLASLLVLYLVVAISPEF